MQRAKGFLLCIMVVLFLSSFCFAGDGERLLSDLSVSANGVGVSLNPAFGSVVLDARGRAAFTAEVGIDVENITVTPAFTLPGLTVSVGSTTVNRDHPSVTLPVAPGATTCFDVVVTRAVGGSVTYSICVTRVALAGLSLSVNGSPIPIAFAPQTDSYSVTVEGAAQSLVVTPIVLDTGLYVTVGGTPISNLQPTVTVSLAVAETTTVTVSVVGVSGLTATYQIVASRAPAPLLCSDITVVLDEEGGYTLTPADIAAITGLPEASADGWAATPDTFDCSCLGAVLVSLYRSGLGGGQATCTATVHVTDEDPPAVVACPPSTASLVYGEGQEFLPDLTFLVQATDNCGVIVSQSPAPGTAWPLGETTVQWLVHDPSGNEAEPCQATLTLRDLPYWPMAGHDPGRTNSSLVYGLANPWFTCAYPQTRAAQESGMDLELVPDFLLIGKAGTLFVRGRERDPNGDIVGEHLLAIDPEQATLVWSFPILAGGGFIPAIGDDGTVYCFDENGWLAALDPAGSEAEPCVTWTIDPLSLLPPSLAEAVQPIWQQFLGAWISYSQPILIGPEGNLYVNYPVMGFTFAFGPPPDRPLLWSLPTGCWPAASAGPGGVLYTRSYRVGELSVAAIGPTGTARWTASIPASAGSSLLLPTASTVTPRGDLILPVTRDADRHDLIILSASDGSLLATYTLPPDVGETALLALGPQGTLFVVTQTLEQTEEGRAIALHGLRLSEEEPRIAPLWSTALGDGWPDAIVVDRSETAYVSIRKRAQEDHAWSDDSLLVVVREGVVRSLLPVWGHVYSVPEVGTGGTNLALGKGGSLYRMVDSARTNDPGGRGNALIKTVTSQDPVLSIVEAAPRSHIGAPPVEFFFKVRIEDPLLRFKDLTLTWDFGDGAVETEHVYGDQMLTYVDDMQEDRQKYHTYASLGTYPLRVTLRLEPEELLVAEFETAVCAQLPEIQQIVFWPRGGAPAFFDAADITEQTILRAYVGQSVSLGSDVDWPCAGSRHVEWRFGDGTSAEGRSVNHAFPAASTYEVQVSAGERPLLSRKTFWVEVLPLPDLVVTAEPREYFPGGLDVHLRVELSSLTPQPLPLTLDLGDGTTEHWQTDEIAHELYHTYATPGSYTVQASVLETQMHAETTVEYSLPPFSLQITPGSGFSPVTSRLVCEPLVHGWPTEGLIYEWTIDNRIIDEWTSEDGATTHYSSPGNEFPYRFTGLGVHSITCYVYDPNSSAGLYSVCGGTVVVLPLPAPDGIRVPFPKDPGIPSGSKCRWACGGDCPDSCVEHADVVIWVGESMPTAQETDYYKLTYSGVISCGTHEGCRWHDDCFDLCAETEGESDAYEPCHMGCNAFVADRYPLDWGISWRGGGGPYDGWFLYSDPPTWEGPFSVPCDGG